MSMSSAGFCAAILRENTPAGVMVRLGLGSSGSRRVPTNNSSKHYAPPVRWRGGAAHLPCPISEKRYIPTKGGAPTSILQRRRCRSSCRTRVQELLFWGPQDAHVCASVIRIHRSHSAGLRKSSSAALLQSSEMRNPPGRRRCQATSNSAVML